MRAVSMIVFGKTVIQSKNEQMRKTFKVFRIFLRMTYNGGDRMRCLRCGNTQQKYFYQDGSVWYCRKCIAFGRMNVGELPRAKKYRQQRHACDYVLKYPLTPKQQKASAEIVWHAKHQQSQLVYAVCGFRVIIVTVANSLGNIRVFELLPKLKTKKYGWCIA